MELEQVLTYAVAVAVPVWLVVEQLTMRRRSARRTEQTASSVATARDRVVRPAALLVKASQKAA